MGGIKCCLATTGAEEPQVSLVVSAHLCAEHPNVGFSPQVMSLVWMDAHGQAAAAAATPRKLDFGTAPMEVAREVDRALKSM